MKPVNRLKSNTIILAAIIFISWALFYPPRAEAALLNLWMDPYPDVFSTEIAVTYETTTHSFSAKGLASSITMDGIGMPFITNADGSDWMGGYLDEHGIWRADSFRIDATIDESGVASGGTLRINGYVLNGGYNEGIPVSNEMKSGALLTGTLTNFGWLEMDDAYAMFEFMFQPTGGDLLPYYDGKPAGVILSLGDFGDYASGTLFRSGFTMESLLSDTAPVTLSAVPIPGAAWLLGSGMFGLYGMRRRLALPSSGCLHL